MKTNFLLSISQILLLATLFAFPLWGGMSAFESNLGIPIGQQFILGGSQMRNVTVKMENRSKSAVELRIRDEKGNLTPPDTIRPRQKTKAQFPARTAAILRNIGDSDALLKVKVSGSTGNLGMSYEDF
jgi:hypothetical protein